MSDINKLREIIENSDNIVFFGGAGVSTESGIPDFRSADGLYSEEFEGVSPEEILSIGYFKRHPDRFYKYYKNNMIYRAAKPNDAHRVLAKLERQGKLKSVVTQNIDGLHQLAGSQNVIELHGTTLSNTCTRCGKRYDLDYVMNSDGMPKCTCGGIIRPDIIMYGEPLDDDVIDEAISAVISCDVLIVGGTSLTVQPAAGFVSLYRGDKLVIINRDPTPYDGKARLVIREKIGETLKAATE